VLFSPGW
jgi:hypothetical protein